jgi:hypothetical protein
MEKKGAVYGFQNMEMAVDAGFYLWDEVEDKDGGRRGLEVEVGG